MRSDQRFIRTSDLRRDFEAIAFFWESLPPEKQAMWRNRFGGWPPRNLLSFTYRIWRETMRLPGGLRPGNVLCRMSPEAKAKLDEKAREVMAAFREIQEKMDRRQPGP
jgi:hypothetical protein